MGDHYAIYLFCHYVLKCPQPLKKVPSLPKVPPPSEILDPPLYCNDNAKKNRASCFM